jgi:glycosyltransferase involved in cell wall biosynthesis
MTSLATPPIAPPAAAAPRTTPPLVDIVVPVHNEAAGVERSLRRLHRFLTDELPFGWRIVVADNGSADATAAIAQRLADELPQVRVLQLEQPGRGRALRTAWAQSDARVVAYMDVDLSTDLRALLPLLAPLVSGHSELAIGTRLARGARVVRGPKRELISRGYNRLLKLALRVRFSDAQCGFKAARADAVRDLLPEVRDDGWFFDTELLVLAQRRGLRIHEVPVDWVDDPDSRVKIVSTALADLRGVARLLLASHVVRFLAIGVASTLAYALLYLAWRAPLGVAGANAAALAVTAVANTAANRLWTFGIRARGGWARDGLLGTLVYLLTLGLTSGAVATLHGLVPHPSRGVEVTALVLASLAATVTRYVALRSWVFGRAARVSRAAPAATSSPRTRTAAGRPF